MLKAIEILKSDEVLRSLVNSIPVPEPHLNPEPYDYLIESIISQQVSYKAAMTIFQRFTEFVSDLDPVKILTMEQDDIKSIGLSRQKAEYIKNAADFKLKGEMEFEKLHPMPDEQIIKHLTQVRGIGRWTAEMILMFPLDRPDVFPVDDLGIINAIRNLYNLESEGKELRIQSIEIAEQWRPYRTLACKYLWNSTD